MKPATLTCVAMTLLALASGVCVGQNHPPGGNQAATLEAVREACQADVARLCAGAGTAPMSRAECMDQHSSQLSEPCKAAREANKAARQAAATSKAAAPNHKAAGATDKAAVTGGAAAATGEATATTGGAAATTGGADTSLDSIPARMSGREFPSIFSPWAGAENLRQPDGRTTQPLSSKETPLATRARHDFFFSDFTSMGLKEANGVQYIVLTPEFSPESIQVALNRRAKLLEMNPHMLILASVQYFSGRRTYLPPDSPYWLHDEKNARFEQNNMEYRSSRLNFANPQFQDKVAAYCAALVKTGVFDGCMMDWWRDDDQMGADRLALVRKIRAAIGEKPLLIGNVGNHVMTSTAQYMNGMYMEGFGSNFFPDWHTAAANLAWSETHLHKPAFTALEEWWHTGRGDLAAMRMVTTLSLVFSNGYALFADPNPLPTPDHLHDWYPFWDKSLGHAAGPLAVVNRPDLSGAYTRQFEKGEAVFNPPGNRPVTVSFPEPRRSAATNTVGRSFTVNGGDGDLFLKDTGGAR